VTDFEKVMEGRGFISLEVTIFLLDSYLLSAVLTFSLKR